MPNWIARIFTPLLLLPLLLSACVSKEASDPQTPSDLPVIPDSKVVDYRIAACDSLWQLDENDAMENSLYWLRAMDCADRLGPAQSRVLANNLPLDGWSSVFKVAILQASAEPTATVRRQMLDRLNGVRMDFPNSLRPLLQLWRQQQAMQISLIEERARYKRLQENSDSQLDALRQNQQQLQYQLDSTSRKLESLTDIERQLSSRKPIPTELPEPADKASKAEKETVPASKSALDGTAAPGR